MGSLRSMIPRPSLVFLIFLSGIELASGNGRSSAKSAGSQCARGLFGAVGERGLGDGPDCSGARRSLPSIQTGEVRISSCDDMPMTSWQANSVLAVVALPALKVEVPRSRYSPLRVVRHTFPKPFLSQARVIATAAFATTDEEGAVNGSWTVTVRSVSSTQFSANVYRTDASTSDVTDGWQGRLVLHYIAWAEGEATSQDPASQGVFVGTWIVPATQPSPRGSPWLLDSDEVKASPSSAEWDSGAGASPASWLAAYAGGQPEVVRVDFAVALDQTPRVLAAIRLLGAYDMQASMSWTVRAADARGFDLNVARVDQAWAVQALAVDYIAWMPALMTATSPVMVPASSRPISGTGSLSESAAEFLDLPETERGNCASGCLHRMAGRVLDPYVLPRAQFGSHSLPPPVPTAAGFANYSYPDSRWGSGFLAAGHGLGARGVRLPSAVQYRLRFEFKDVFVERTPFNFSRPPFVVATPRVHRDRVREHAREVRDTVAVTVVEVTASGFAVNVLRTDRSGGADDDRGGRGWLKAVDVDWIAWEPWVDDLTVLESGLALSVQLRAGEYKFFRATVFDHVHDLVVRVNDSSPSSLSWTDHPVASEQPRPIAWLPHHVYDSTGPSAEEAHLVLDIASSVAIDGRNVNAALKMLNDRLVEGAHCEGGFKFDRSQPSTPFRLPVRCDSSQPDGGGAPWPFSVAYLWVDAARAWKRLECAGIGCPHRLPLSVSPVILIASTLVTHPTREFVGSALAAPEAAAQHSGELSDPWVSDFLSLGAEVRVYSTDPRFRVGRYYVGALAMADTNFTITAHVGRVVPVGGSPDVVPYEGHMVVHRQYGGSVEPGRWVYFRITLSAADINSNRAITVVNVEHDQPDAEVDVYVRRGEAPVDSERVGEIGGWRVFARDVFSNATRGRDLFDGIVHGWRGVQGVSECGVFGAILGGQRFLGHGSKVAKRFIVPRQHTLLRVRTTFVKIDLWDGSRASLLVDGREVWARTFTCDVLADGMCGNSTLGSLQCGWGDRPDEGEAIDVVVPHTQPTATLEFLTDLPAVPEFALFQSWGLGTLTLEYQHEYRRSAMWVDSDTLLYSSNSSIPPTDVSESCTVNAAADGPGCEWRNGSRICVQGKCSRKSYMYRFGLAGEYFVGVYGYNLTATQHFVISTTVQSDAEDPRFGRDPQIVSDKRAEPSPLIQTYPRVSVAHGPGVSIGLTGVPASFYLRSKDKYGNLRTSGGDEFDITFEGPCGLDMDLSPHPACGVPTYPPPTTDIIDVGGGSYVALYTLTVGGRYTMSVKLHGLHIRGSPFQVVSQPDAELLVAATGAEWGASHIRFNSTVPLSGTVGERMYTYYAVAVPDMVADLIVTVSEVQGEVDVLVSNTQTHPSHNVPADVQWQSDHVTLTGSVHRIHVRYTDPLFLAGNHYIAVYGRQNATFVINATTEQVAREIQIGPTYGAVVTSAGNCSSDADCSASAGLQCFSQACRQQRRFRFRPHPAAHAHYVRVAINDAEGWSHNASRCAPVAVFLTRAAPYPEGTLVDAAASPANGTAGCTAVYALALVNEGCGRSTTADDALQQRSLQRCAQPVDGSQLYYVTVQAAGGSGTASSVSVRLLSSSRDSLTADALFASPPAASPQRTPPARTPEGAQEPNSTRLELGAVVYGRSETGADSFFIAEVADLRSELLCVAAASSGALMLFMSTTDRFPSRLQSHAIQWRSDDEGGGAATASIRARPTDAGFRVGEFYIAVHGHSSVDFNLSCNVSAATHAPTARVGGIFGGRVTAGGYTFYRLPIEAHHQLVVFTAKLSDVGPTYTNRALALYLQRSPSATASTLPMCEQPAPTLECLVPYSTNSSCPACGYPFATDEAAMEHPEYQGTTTVQAKLLAGQVYYVAVASQSDTAAFSVSIQST